MNLKHHDNKLLLLIIIFVFFMFCCCICAFSIFLDKQIKHAVSNDKVNSTSTFSQISKFSSNYTQCNNRVLNDNGKLYWPDGCKGMVCEKLAISLCTSQLVPLNLEEQAEFNNWSSSKKPKLIGCECYEK